MTIYRFRGDEANLRVLLKELEENQDVARAARLEIRTVDYEGADDALRYGPVAEIVVSLATGFASGAALEGLKAAIHRARHRGTIEETVAEQDHGDDAGTSPS